MYDFSKASDTEKYFDDIMNKLGNSKIIGVYCILSFWGNRKPITYMQDEPLYIIFDNGQCIVIDYYFINELNIEFRAMTTEERQLYEAEDTKDLFNRTTKIYDSYTGKVVRTEKSVLSYGSLQSIELKRITEPYSAWIEGAIIDEINPAEGTFNDIKFIMDNGRSFTIRADDAESDGYSLIWSEDAETTILLNYDSV